ncbi:aspartyl/asparaginyl beta-hydroxylase domain-containing protein [Steroidobacter sp.]|uniref:aspartyl/asparaginyl beta-hydroxylase domain-containing protein n=1 Tax=Steroidobacter sp. TaxID=1978227 RepID=UPI001A376C55|nr:aspartyl/asparaginyl beta-hydroxylase domain-containing protein [Steroidobacter sp.]MBL8269684.1 aspartyl/asparaginyl beta-hydroxylase domain-containing protein [Steroidobacter sp.]
MLDLPGQPVLDKIALVGGCLRLPLQIDAQRLVTQIEALPDSLWGSQGGRVGVHRVAEALFLRGYAPAQGALPIEDREALALLPYAREIIEQLIPAPAQRCLLARLPAGATIDPHIDRAPYFSKTLRLHFPIESHDQAWMIAGPLTYLMKPGEVWVLNNSSPHAVWNADPERSRTHMICDFLATPALLELMAAGDRDLGRSIPAVEQHFAAHATG